MESNREERLVRIAEGRVLLEGNLTLPKGARGIVLFAHGSGRSRFSPRNGEAAQSGKACDIAGRSAEPGGGGRRSADGATALRYRPARRAAGWSHRLAPCAAGHGTA